MLEMIKKLKVKKRKRKREIERKFQKIECWLKNGNEKKIVINLRSL